MENDRTQFLNNPIWAAVRGEVPTCFSIRRDIQRLTEACDKEGGPLARHSVWSRVEGEIRPSCTWRWLRSDAERPTHDAAELPPRTGATILSDSEELQLPLEATRTGELSSDVASGAGESQDPLPNEALKIQSAATECRALLPLDDAALAQLVRFEVDDHASKSERSGTLPEFMLEIRKRLLGRASLSAEDELRLHTAAKHCIRESLERQVMRTFRTGSDVAGAPANVATVDFWRNETCRTAADSDQDKLDELARRDDAAYLAVLIYRLVKIAGLSHDDVAYLLDRDRRFVKARRESVEMRLVSAR